MKKDGILRIGKPVVLSFSGKAATDFTGLTKEKQIEYLSENLSPKGDTQRAEILLKGVPHGEGKPPKAEQTK